MRVVFIPSAAALLVAWSLRTLTSTAVVNADDVTIAVAVDALVGAEGDSDEVWVVSLHGEAVAHDRFNASAFVDHTKHDDAHEIILSIGVKTNVVHGAAARHAIRATWGQRATALSLGVRVWFVGCAPDLSTITTTERQHIQETIELEKATYHDLLTHELRCEDTLTADLVDKTIEFLHFEETTTSAGPMYVMMADDNVYVRLDQLVELLQSGTLEPERLYAGNAATAAQRDPNPPDRDPQSPRFVPFDEYPMSELPPFVSGAHYVLSRDMVQFIARNRDDLEGLSGLDDVTMALWMLALQVHPVFLDRFQVLESTPCRDDVVSLAGLSPVAMQEIHANLHDGRMVCANQLLETWRDRRERNQTGDDAKNEDEAAAANLTFAWDVQHDAESGSLQIQVDIRRDDGHATLVYVPSMGSFTALFCPRLLDVMRTTFSLSLRPSFFCAHTRRLLQHFLQSQGVLSPPLRAKLAIARHNLARAEADDAADAGTLSPTLSVVLSPQATYSRVMLECLLTRIYPMHHVAVLNEADLAPHAPPPDVFVFSMLDDGLPRNKPAHAVATGAGFVNRYGPTSRLLMVSGEAWPTHQLHPDVILLSTVTLPGHAKQIYVPYAAAAFGEMVRHDPTQLLHRRDATTASDTSRRFGAYLYSNCGVTKRELMFELVNAIAPVDALGRCQGLERKPDESRLQGRRSLFFADDAVVVYRDYKFVIAFESFANEPGYVTEKIVTAFLAGAVPIYYGDSASVTRLFNPDAFIDCGAFTSLYACADHVRNVHESPTVYEAMRQAAPITNHTAFREVFSWHPAVRDEALASDATDVSDVVEQLRALLLREQ